MVNIFIARALRGRLYLNTKPYIFRYLAITIIIAGKKGFTVSFPYISRIYEKTNYPLGLSSRMSGGCGGCFQ